ncbi:MAG: hypothetical protein AAF969_02030 [Bacteroidota bacterium]
MVLQMYGKGSLLEKAFRRNPSYLGERPNLRFVRTIAGEKDYEESLWDYRKIKKVE